MTAEHIPEAVRDAFAGHAHLTMPKLAKAMSMDRELIDGKMKWIIGLRWEEIDAALMLRHTTSKRGKDIEVDLHHAPMVMEELALIEERPQTGPIVRCAFNGLPFKPGEFRRKWRMVATAAGVPAHVYNMDSRAGAITEASDAGADDDHIRQTATHSQLAMTQRYKRGNHAEKQANVMRQRVAHRKKKSQQPQPRRAAQ